MGRAKSYYWRGTVVEILGANNLRVQADGDLASITSTGIIAMAQGEYADTPPALNDRVTVLAIGAQHYAQGKFA